MTVKHLLTSVIIDQLDPHEAELLLAHTLGKPREFIVAHPEAKVGLFDYWKFKRLIHKRKKGVPIAYLTGYKEFYGLDFVVNRHVLIPRPETETLVDEIINHKSEIINQHTVFIDVGTGSGCIAIAVAKTIGKIKRLEDYKIMGIDTSAKALKVARKNAEKHDVEIEFLHGNLLDPFLNNRTTRLPARQVEQLNNRTIFITANLPYLTDAQYHDEPTIQHEPKSALVAHDHGLSLYRELLQQIFELASKKILKYCNIIILFEIDPSQSQQITALIYRLFPSAKVEIKKDLAGRDRVVCVNL